MIQMVIEPSIKINFFARPLVSSTNKIKKKKNPLKRDYLNNFLLGNVSNKSHLLNASNKFLTSNASYASVARSRAYSPKPLTRGRPVLLKKRLDEHKHV